jgi:ACR3 family arsenite efflux pump ArsB
MIQRLLAGIKAHLIHVVLGSLAAGLAFGQVAGPETEDLLKAAVVPVLFLMIYPMMINIDLREILNVRGHAKPVSLSLPINFLVAPLLAAGLSRLFFAGAVEYAIGLYLGPHPDVRHDRRLDGARQG